MALPREMTPAAMAKWQAYAEDLIAQAIALLDEVDGDPDLEENSDLEPNLAGSPSDLEEDTADDEPWIVPLRLDAAA
jgi:hypothetical protein